MIYQTAACPVVRSPRVAGSGAADAEVHVVVVPRHLPQQLQRVLLAIDVDGVPVVRPDVALRDAVLLGDLPGQPVPALAGDAEVHRVRVGVARVVVRPEVGAHGLRLRGVALRARHRDPQISRDGLGRVGHAL
jgi:hypothetical protein